MDKLENSRAITKSGWKGKTKETYLSVKTKSLHENVSSRTLVGS